MADGCGVIGTGGWSNGRTLGFIVIAVLPCGGLSTRSCTSVWFTWVSSIWLYNGFETVSTYALVLERLCPRYGETYPGDPQACAHRVGSEANARVPQIEPL